VRRGGRHLPSGAAWTSIVAMTAPPALDEIMAELRALLPELRRRWPISYLGVFGSWARGQQRPDSDLDLLVDFDGPIDLYAFVELQETLADRLGRRVDLVHRPGLKPFIGAEVRREVQSL
jgi:predicted nucleotidyltransferase